MSAVAEPGPETRAARPAPLPALLRGAMTHGAFFLVVIGVYSLALALDPGLRRFLPTIGELVLALAALAVDPQFWAGVGATAEAAGLGLAISMVGGSLVALVLATGPRVYDSARFLIDFLRTIPPLALIPVGLLLLGPTTRMEVTLIVASAIWPVVLQVYYGIVHLDPKYLETARSYRVGRARQILFIVAPGVAPSFGTAFRLAASMTLLLAVGTELLAGSDGLGFLIGWYQQARRLPEMYATIIVVGVLGIAVNATIRSAERRLFAWAEETR